MEGKNLGIVVNNTDYAPGMKSFVKKSYRKMAYRTQAPVFIEGLDPLSFLDRRDLDHIEPLGQVRAAGDRHDFGSSDYGTLMHSKFLVFGDIQPASKSKYFASLTGEYTDDCDKDADIFVPYGYWTGSFNCTKKNNIDSGTYIESHAAACQMLEQWFRLYHFQSVPFDWHTFYGYKCLWKRHTF